MAGQGFEAEEVPPEAGGQTGAVLPPGGLSASCSFLCMVPLPLGLALLPLHCCPTPHLAGTLTELVPTVFESQMDLKSQLLVSMRRGPTVCPCFPSRVTVLLGKPGEQLSL